MGQSCLVRTFRAGVSAPLRLPPAFSKYSTRLLLGLFCALQLTACATANGGFAVSNVPVDNRRYEVIAPGEEVTLSWWSLDLGIIGLPLSDPPVAEAEAELLRRTQGDALVNLRYWNDRSILLMLFNRQRFYLKADVIRFEPEPARRGRRR